MDTLYALHAYKPRKVSRKPVHQRRSRVYSILLAVVVALILILPFVLSAL